jgi:hypothetical protein
MFAGGASFPDNGVVARVWSMLSGRRSSRPELSGGVREIINGCLEIVPSRRKTIADVVVALDGELNPHQLRS